MVRRLLWVVGLAGCASAPDRPAPRAPSPAEVDAAMGHWSAADTAPDDRATVSSKRLAAPPLDQVVRIGPPPPPPPAARRSGRRVDIELHRAALPAALQLLADEARLNLVLGEGITGEVSLSLRRVDPSEALEALASSHNLTLDRQGSILIVRRR